MRASKHALVPLQEMLVSAESCQTRALETPSLSCRAVLREEVRCQRDDVLRQVAPLRHGVSALLLAEGEQKVDPRPVDVSLKEGPQQVENLVVTVLRSEGGDAESLERYSKLRDPGSQMRGALVLSVLCLGSEVPVVEEQVREAGESCCRRFRVIVVDCHLCILDDLPDGGVDVASEVVTFGLCDQKQGQGDGWLRGGGRACSDLAKDCEARERTAWHEQGAHDGEFVGSTRHCASLFRCSSVGRSEGGYMRGR